MGATELQCKSMRERARRLRREQTIVEGLLWRHLRNRQLLEQKFRRQHPVARYIVDFVCLSRNLIVELDGAQHAEQQKAYDRERDDDLRGRGFRVIRFWNKDVLENLDGVLGRIRKELEDAAPDA